MEPISFSASQMYIPSSRGVTLEIRKEFESKIWALPVGIFKFSRRHIIFGEGSPPTWQSNSASLPENTVISLGSVRKKGFSITQ